MNLAPIDIAYEAGIPVVLLATRRAAAEIHPLAEDLIVAGAAIEVVSGVDHDPAAVDEVLARVPEPRVLAVVRLAMERAPVRASERCEAVANEQTRFVSCEIVPGLVRAAAGVILAAMRGSQRDVAQEQHESQALASVLADLRAEGHDSCDDLPVVAPKPVVTSSVATTRRRRRRWPFAALPIAVAAVAWIALRSSPRGAASEPSTPAVTVVARASETPRPPALSTPPMRAAAEFEAQGPSATAAVEPARPSPEVAPPVVTVTPAHAEAQPVPPASDAATSSVDAHDVLAQAIARGRVRRVDDLVAYPLAGERDWYAAMTSCRARAFWGASGWRVPTIDELHRLARARLFAGAHVWSSVRAADHDFALVLALSGGTVETASKAAETREVICVLSRPEEKP